ncbi:ABC transporter permease [Myxococcus sp. AM011]|uniref:ABC transporter permease n=1 Tax=Myxococcus sp. AM011 TaxID=2745200 RepID=UPI00159623B8|nr:ABC transporter permease [Myxococcus sp. AM011]NVJ25251.1 ABC transporter permease [Myxococcus sp. AM011]
MSAPVESSVGSASFQERWGDRLNPLVVKEVRQGLRTRIFWASFGLNLIACVVLALVAFVQTRELSFSHHGQGYFFAFFICLAVAHYFVIPYGAYRSLAREREDDTWVLLVLTGLGPRRILRGKVASALVQAGLYASAVGPFLLFSYYLNGISLPSILTVLGLGGTWLVFLTVVAVCAATLAESRMGRAFMHFVVLGALGMAFSTALGIGGALSDSGSRLLSKYEVQLAMGVWLGVMVLDGWLLFEVAASRLSLSTEDYTKGPRRAVVAQMLVALLVGLGFWWYEDRKHVVTEIFSICGTVHLTFVGLFLVSDVDGQARALRAGTGPLSLFRPGALRGFRLTVLLFGVWAAVWGALALVSDDMNTNSEAMRMLMMVMPAYAVLYLSLALVLGRMPRSDRFSSPASVRLLFVAAVGVAAGLPPLLAELAGFDMGDPLLNLLNPVVGIANFGTHDYSTGEPEMTWPLATFVVGVALLLAFLADRALVEREKRAHLP